MGTAADKLKYLVDTKNAIKEAIAAKGVSVADSDTFRSYADKISGISVGGAEVNDVNFRDYNGTILHSYSKEGFLALSAMPESPTHQGLIFQEWNWSLEDAKAFVNEYGKVDIGATYITDDGKTRFYISIVTKGRMDFSFNLSISAANSLVVDWGDGVTESVSGSGSLTMSHHYEAIGDYVIAFSVSNGATLSFGTTSTSSYDSFVAPYNCMVRKLEFGERVSIQNYAFNACYLLASVVIPNNISSIRRYAFSNCHSLTSIVIPNSVTSIDYNAFRQCYSLTSAVIPNSVTSIEEFAFGGCYSLTSIVIPNKVTALGKNAFSTCNSLTSAVIPNSVTSIGASAFSGCYALASIVIPNGATLINSDVFRFCLSLTFVVIPNNVKTLNSNAFYGCSGVAFFDFRTHTSVPTLASYSVFSSTAADCKFIVPDALYDSWIAASIWSTSYASQIIKASEYNG